jgi:Domain of unknown function (DUF4440)
MASDTWNVFRPSILETDRMTNERWMSPSPRVSYATWGYVASLLVRYSRSGRALLGCGVLLLAAVQTAPSFGNEPPAVGVQAPRASDSNIEKADAGGNPPSSPGDLAVAVEGYRRAQKAGDRDALNRVLADTYVLIKGNAESNDKAQLIADLTDPAMRIDRYLVSNSKQILWSDGALVISEVRLIGMRRGQVLASHLRLTDLWQRQAGQWRVVFSQATHFPQKIAE